METSNAVKKVMKVLAPILFPVKLEKFKQFTRGFKRLPGDRQWCVNAYTDGIENPPECTYIGGEKYVLVENSEVLNPLVLVLQEKFKNLRVRVGNTDNEVFVVDFFSEAPDRRKNDYIAPVIRVENSYNGKKKAKATAAIYAIDKNGKESFYSTKSNVNYVFKHHSDEGAVKIAEIAGKVDEMLAEFNNIEQQIETLKKFEVKEITKTLEELVPDAKKYPKKAVSLAVELVGYETNLMGTTPNLWIMYTALAQAVKKSDFESSLKDWQKEEADAVAWENCLNYAAGQKKTKKKK
jgi:hypothetical protein